MNSNQTHNQSVLAQIMGALNNKTGALNKPARTEYERRPGTGALFGTVNQETGEIVITGSFRAPEGGMELTLVGKLADDGQTIILTGDVVGHENLPFQVAGELKPQSYDADYKGGFIAVVGPKAKYVWTVNSKSATSKTSDKPYRFVWFTRGATVSI